jgi:hypothetical protein
VIRVMPYRGHDNEVTEGRQTRVTLYPDRIEWKIRYSMELSVVRDSGDKESIPTLIDEEGVIAKEFITSICKTVKNDIIIADEEGTEIVPAKNNHIYNVNIYSSGDGQTIECENKEERDGLYNAIYEWKFNKTNNSTNE